MPNAGRAIVDLSKLRDYCLSTDHPRGRHKARVFEAAIGLTADDADQLRDVLLDAAQGDRAVTAEQDQYGQRYVLDLLVNGPAGTAMVRSTWIVRRDEDFPRLTSCYVL
jgi:hypothetical protein